MQTTGEEGIVFYVSEIALYFPYANFPSDTWVKAAVLHWVQLGRINPRDYYGRRDSDTVKQLRDELDFIVEIGPGRDGQAWVDPDIPHRVDADYFRWNGGQLDTAEAVETLFYDFLNRYKDELIPRYGVDALRIESPDTEDVSDELVPLDPRLQEVHTSKMSYRLAQRLADVGLLISRGSLLAMDRRLADVYLAVLADVIAQENNMTPITDQPLLCAATSGWTIEAMARILLDDAETTEDQTDCSNVFAVLALQTVLPRDLAEVPVDRIIEARQRLLPDLMRYREFLDSLTPDFLELSMVRNPEVRAAKLRNYVESKIAQPIEAMEHELGRLGLRPARAVISLKTLAPPTVLGVLADAVHLPSAVTSAGVVAGCLVGAADGALDRRREVLGGHPASYLLNLRRELSPSDTVARIRSAIRRATPQRRRLEHPPGHRSARFKWP